MLRSSLFNRIDSIVHGFGRRHDDLAQFLPGYWARRPVQRERHGTASPS